MTTLEQQQQQEAAAVKAGRPAGSSHQYDDATQRRLDLEQRERAAGQPVAEDDGVPEPRPKAHLGHGTGQLRHEHLMIDGHSFDVTEDDIGVAEMLRD